MMLGPLLDHLESEFTRNNVSILHMKAIVDSSAGFVKGGYAGMAKNPRSKGPLLRL